jgi:hypothetical protein
MTTRVEWVETTCACGCGVTFRQLRDPGREREYLNNAHKQRAYRARNPHRSHSGTRKESASARRRREEQEAWAREEARREQERQRSESRRGRGRTHFGDKVPGWCYSSDTDATKRAKRRTARLLYERATHSGTPAEEAAACMERAEQMKVRYGL